MASKKYEFNTTPERSELMSKIRGKETTPEVLLRKSLWKEGIRYRKNNKKVRGCPDISISKFKIAIFVDGDFWHGYNWQEKKKKLKANRKYWIKKIERNMVRDTETTYDLNKDGWTVIRIWENEIKVDVEGCVKKIIEAIRNKPFATYNALA